MKLKGLILMTSIFLSLFGLCSCADKNDNENTAEYITEDITQSSTDVSLTYNQISQEEAKRIMDSKTEFVIIDARTQSEFDEGHIRGAILIPEYEISERAENEIPDKDTLILVYCRSGRRSKIASEALVALGYTNVKEFGGIIDWQYETVK